MNPAKAELVAELRSLTQELETLRVEFSADGVIDEQEKATLAEVQHEIDTLKLEIKELEQQSGPHSDETEVEDPLEAELRALLTLPHMQSLSLTL